MNESIKIIFIDGETFINKKDLLHIPYFAKTLKSNFSEVFTSTIKLDMKSIDFFKMLFMSQKNMVGTFNEFYKKNWHMFDYYCIDDNIIDNNLDDITKLIDFDLRDLIEKNINTCAFDEPNLDKYIETQNLKYLFIKGDKYTPLMIITKYSKYINIYHDLIKCFIRNGAEISIRTSTGMTALMVAVSNTRNNCCEEAVLLLLELKAKINSCEENGYTPLMLASMYSKTLSTENTVKILIDAKADLNIKNESGKTALMLASKYSGTSSTINTVKLLLEAGSKINLCDDNGNNSLMIAIKNIKIDSSIEVIKILLDSNINTEIFNNNKENALILANDYQLHDIVKLLKK